jgi:two-component system cell cycle response regulator
MSEEVERERAARQSAESLNQELKTEATRDALTGCLNRRGLDQFLAALATDKTLSQSAVSVLVLDLDHFKAINDTRGHHVGDWVLKACVKTWQSSIRSADLVVRLGGEEYAILLLRNTPEQAYVIAEKLRKATESISLSILDQADPVRITVSIGVAHASQTSKRSIDMLMMQADKAMYEAKQSGRNRVRQA